MNVVANVEAARLQVSQVAFKLSVIVPFRDDPALPYLMERLKDQIHSFPQHPAFEFIVVDSGSNPTSAAKCKAICENAGVSYLPHGREGEVFSIGAARDFGAQFATGNAVTFFDIDWRAPSDFWSRLVAFADTYGISKKKKAFFTVPALYLTQDATAEFEQAESDGRFMEMYLRWQRGDKTAAESYAPCSSIIVVDRLHYLSVGGHRPEFRGHGFEDFELYHRLIGDAGILPRPTDYFADKRSWDHATYDGFRALFSLLGRPAQMAGLFVVHLWHPRPKKASFYNSNAMGSNRALWIDLFEHYDETGRHPTPLTASEHMSETTTFFARPEYNAAECVRDAQPLLGNIKYAGELDYLDENKQLSEERLKAYIEHHNVSRMLFHAPYGNDARLQVYEWCRRTSFPYLVFERGALPDSWFFDPNGFNADSAIYSREKWDFPLSDEDRRKTVSYIQNIVNGWHTLEAQGRKVGGESLRVQLGLAGKKVLFVPLQRPSDTVIKFMAGDPNSAYERFLKAIDKVAEELKHLGWVVLCKKHPLETNSPELRFAKYVAADTHFIDLIELSDAVALINSGVGVYAMMMEKPCYIFGQAFYAFDGINSVISNYDPSKLVEALKGAPFKVDQEAMLRFVKYLVSDFYSFAHARTVTREEADGSLRTITTGLDFYDLRIPGVPHVAYDREQEAEIDKSAPLFERFKHDLSTRKLKRPATPGTVQPVDFYDAAVSAYKKGEFMEAGEMFLSAFEKDRQSPNLLRYAAEAFAAAGARKKAIATLNDAAKEMPKNRRLRRRRLVLRYPILASVIGSQGIKVPNR